MKYLLIIFLSFTTLLVSSQEKGDRTRAIEVKGSSEIEITPDEIFVRITLKEYKKGGGKVTLNALESELIKSLKKIGIPQEKLTVENLNGYNWNWKKRKPEDFMGSKSFILEVSNLKKMNDLVDMLDPEGLNNVNIQSYSHSDIEGYRKQVKIGAIKVAQEKATYLLESVGAQLGELLEVQEVDYGYQRPMMNMRSNMAFEDATNTAYQSNVEFMKIKVRAEMRVVFGIN